MGMNQIPLRDTEKVVNRLSVGQSYSQAMADTSIKSKDTVHRIAQKQSNVIEQKRQQYLKKIKKNGANDDRRAAMWSRMTFATKRVGKDALEVPDWSARTSALTYIDKLAGLDNPERVKMEVTNNERIIDLRSSEAIDFSKKFKEFLQRE